MKKTLTIIALVVVIGGLAWLLGSKASQPEIDPAGWQTYRNEELGFEFEYPAYLEPCHQLNEEGSEPLICLQQTVVFDTPSDNPVFRVKELTSQFNSYQALKKHYIDDFVPSNDPTMYEINPEEIEIGGVLYIKTSSCDAGCVFDYSGFLNGRPVNFSYITGLIPTSITEQKKDMFLSDEVAEKIISTFRFVSALSTPPEPTPGPLVTRLTNDQMSLFAVDQMRTPKFKENARVNQVFRGDLNQDNFSDAVVTLFSCDASCGSFTWVILDNNGAPQLSNARFPSFGFGAQNPRLNVLAVDHGIITVDRILEEKSTGARSYKLQGSNLIEVSATENDTTGWQTYRGVVGAQPVDSRREVEFKYPVGWRAKNFYYTGSRFPERADPNEIAAGVDLVSAAGEKIVVFGARASMDTGTCADRLGSGIYGGATKCVNFPQVPIGDVRTNSSNPQVLEIFDRIISSIRFADNFSVGETGWQTYRNEELGFEFKYPADWILKPGDKQTTKDTAVIRVINPERAGRPDTDIPVEYFLVRKKDSPCLGTAFTVGDRAGLDSGWSVGFAWMNYRSVCFDVRDQNFELSLVAYDQPSKETMEKILSTFRFLD